MRDDPSTSRNSDYLVVDSLVKHYRVRRLTDNATVRAIDDVSLSVKAGEVMGLVGESGCGKSTFARLITRLTTPTAGNVIVAGENWLHLHGEKLRRRRREIQLIFQDPYAALDPRMKVGTSMEAPLAQHNIGTTSDRHAQVLAMLNEVGLDESFYDRLPRQCSGGQLQRIVVGRALLLKPGLLICDEPTSALDASMTTQILNLLLELKRRHGLTIILISHDLRVVKFLCDRIAVMYLGKLVEVADTKKLFDQPAHPYTQSLMAAALLDKQSLVGADALIDGDVPSPLEIPEGCAFHTRCAYAREDCTGSVPALEQSHPGHFVRCHHWNRLKVDRLAPR